MIRQINTDTDELLSDLETPTTEIGDKLSDAIRELARTQGSGHPLEVEERQRRQRRETPPPPQRSIKDMTDAVDRLEVDDTGMIHAFTLEAENIARRLRHRAHLMRLRAKEFEDEADTLLGIRLKEVTDAITSLSSNLRTANDVLRAHAHIEPQRVQQEDRDEDNVRDG